MKTYKMNEFETMRDLIAEAQRSDEPVIVFDGDDECLVAMRPPVFERILADVDFLAYEGMRHAHL